MRRSWSILREYLTWPYLAAGLFLRSQDTPGDLIEERFTFGPAPEQYVLVIRPVERSTTRPLIAFVHGGSWAHFSPVAFRAVGRWLARQGYATALLGYRLAPGAVFPAQREDVFEGLGATRRQPWFGSVCNGSVIAMGQSSGGELAALLALDEESRVRCGLSDLSIAGLVSISGVVDFGVMGPTNSVVATYMGGSVGWDAADPAHFAHGARVPILCLHGSRDPLVPVEVAASFVLRANGAEGDHASLLADARGRHGNLTWLLLGRSPLTRPLLDWMDGLPPV